MKLGIPEGDERKSKDMPEFEKPLKSVLIKIGGASPLHAPPSGSNNNNYQNSLTKNKFWRLWFKFWPT